MKVLSDEQIEDILRELRYGEKQGNIAKKYGVDASVISRVNTGSNYKDKVKKIKANNDSKF